MASQPLASWRLALLFTYNIPCHLLFLSILQHSYSAYLYYGTMTEDRVRINKAGINRVLYNNGTKKDFIFGVGSTIK